MVGFWAMFCASHDARETRGASDDEDGGYESMWSGDTCVRVLVSNAMRESPHSISTRTRKAFARQRDVSTVGLITRMDFTAKLTAYLLNLPNYIHINAF